MEASEQTMAQQLDLYGCYQCGKSTGGCPVSLKSRVNIRRWMMEGILGRNLEHLSERLELWDCTTCKTCTLRCPRGHRSVQGLQVVQSQSPSLSLRCSRFLPRIPSIINRRMFKRDFRETGHPPVHFPH